MTPFEALYGYAPPTILDYIPSKKRRHGSDIEVLVQWNGATQEDATWELLFKV
jgi:hypothetical protein